MTDTKRTPIVQWTKAQAAILAAICLLAGIAGGWTIRAVQTPAGAGSAQVTGTPAPAGPAPSAPSPAQLKAMADAQAAPLLEKLKANGNDAGLLTDIGNLYYDAHQYPDAVDYYGRALKIAPGDAAVRTDRGTAYWYMGNADAAIAEFDKALSDAPNNPNTLFNRGLVRWKGKADSAGAIADWEKLLATDPNYEEKDKVQQMMAEAKQHASASQAAPAK